MEKYTRKAIEAVQQAAASETDFGGWLASVLATAGANLEDGTVALVSGRPGSWEAQHVMRLAEGGTDLSEDSLGI